MKKNLLCFFITICLIFSCAFFTNYQTNILHAEDISVVGLYMALYQGTSVSDLPMENDDNVYSIKFNENFLDNEEISDTNLPYKRYYIGIRVDTSPIVFEDLSIPEKLQLFSEAAASFTINGETVVFEGQTARTNDYELIVLGDMSTRINISFCAYKPGPMVIACSAGYYTASMTVNCEYAEPSKVELSTTDSFEQLYENYTPIRVTAVFNNSKYIDTSAEYTYMWYLDNTELNVHTNFLQITKDMIKVGTIRLTLEIIELPLLIAQENIVISTEIGYEVSLTHTGGDLTQTIGDNIQPINFMASIPTTETYTVTWYLKKADTNIYQKQNSTGPVFMFNSAIYNAGIYKIFAEAYTSQTQLTVRSNVLVIELKTKPADVEKKFDIYCKEYKNSATSVTAYECSVEASEYYKEDEIVWSINGIQYAQGSHFNFEPQYADDYVISVRLRNASGTSTNSIAVRAKSVESSNIWLYIAIAGVALIGICTLSIIISNKKREKIW